MKKISSINATRAILGRYGFHNKKRFGQNFLIDAGILEDIVDAAEVEKEDLVIEIGPGIGTMTQLLCERAGHVLAVEIDRQLIPILEETLSFYDNAEIVNEDILKFDLESYLEKTDYERVKVVANLPYYITTPVIMGLLESKQPFTSMTFLVQKEVAERMCTGPGSKDYGALSLAVQYYTSPRICFTVPGSCFFPPPKVESAVITLACHEKPPVEVKDEALLFLLIRASFNQRRKTLANGIANGANLSLSKEEIISVIEDAGFPGNVRGEKLTLEEFARLSDAFGAAKKPL